MFGKRHEKSLPLKRPDREEPEPDLEPGAVKILMGLAEIFGQELHKILTIQGRKYSEGQCVTLAQVQIKGAFRVAQLVDGLNPPPVGSLSDEKIGFYRQIELECSKAILENRTEDYPGLSAWLLEHVRELEMNLSACDLDTLDSLGIEPEDTDQHLRNIILTISKSGFTVGISQALARVEHWILAGEPGVITSRVQDHYVHMSSAVRKAPGLKDMRSYILNANMIISRMKSFGSWAKLESRLRDLSRKKQIDQWLDILGEDPPHPILNRVVSLWSELVDENPAAEDLVGVLAERSTPASALMLTEMGWSLESRSDLKRKCFQGSLRTFEGMDPDVSPPDMRIWWFKAAIGLMLLSDPPDLRDALGLFDRLIEQEQDLDNVYILSSCAINTADLLSDAGHMQEARLFLECGALEAARVVESGRLDHASRVAESLMNLADTYRYKGDLSTAMVHLKRSRNMLLMLSGETGQDALGEQLGKVESDLALLLSQSGDIPGATAMVADAERHMDKAVENTGGHNPLLLDSLARVHLLNGDLLRKTGHLDSALEAYQKAGNIRLFLLEKTELTPKDKADLSVQLAAVYNNLGNLFSDLDRIGHALKAYKLASKICKKNLKKFDPAARIGMAQVLYNTANALRKAGKSSRALKTYRKSMDLWRQLTSEHEGFLEPRMGKIRTQRMNADFFVEEGKPQQAIEIVDAAISDLEKIQQTAESSDLSLERARLENVRGKTHLALGHPEEASKAHMHAIELLNDRIFKRNEQFLVDDLCNFYTSAFDALATGQRVRSSSEGEEIRSFRKQISEGIVELLRVFGGGGRWTTLPARWRDKIQEMVEYGIRADCLEEEQKELLASASKDFRSSLSH